MQKENKIDVLDFLIECLIDHQTMLDHICERLEKITGAVEKLDLKEYLTQR